MARSWARGCADGTTFSVARVAVTTGDIVHSAGA
jgi:hypothetical protein